MEPLQIRRFQVHATALKAFLKPGTNIDAAITEMVQKDARLFLFRLESLLRLYARIYGEPFQTMRIQVKAFEDALGHYIDRAEFLEFAREIKAPSRVIAFMEKKEQEFKEALRLVLVASGWVPTNATKRARLDQIMDDLKDEKWKQEKKDTKALIQQIGEELKTLESLDFNLSVLGPGIHKMRRELRWILIHLQALDGLILLKNTVGVSSNPVVQALESHPMASGKFSKIPQNDYTEHPIFIPKYLYLALSRTVEVLGDVKKVGERLEALAEAFLESGAMQDQSQAYSKAEELMKKDGSYFDFYKAASRVRDELLRSGWLHEMRKALEAQLD